MTAATTADLAWRAYYSATEWVDEHDAQGAARGWAAVDAARVVLVEWRARAADTVRLSVPVPEGAEAVVLRRVSQVLDLTGAQPDAVRQTVIPMAGWRCAADAGIYAFLLPDGAVHVTNDFDGV